MASATLSNNEHGGICNIVEQLIYERNIVEHVKMRENCVRKQTGDISRGYMKINMTNKLSGGVREFCQK